MPAFLKQLGLAAVLACFSQAAFSGAIYTYSLENPTARPAGNPNGGNVTSLNTTFNTNNNDFSWNYTVESQNDGFWLVVSDGANPKGHAGEYAILYGDLDQQLLWAYEYNGQNRADSYKPGLPGNLLGHWGSSAFNIVDQGNGYKDVSVSINATAVNNSAPLNNSPAWDGISFGANIGLWFHPSIGTSTTLGANNSLANFSYQRQGWADLAYQTTTEVPEPGTMSLMLAALLALFAMQAGTLARVMRKFSTRDQSVNGFAVAA